MNTKWRLGKHPGEDSFEDYSFDRLSEQGTAIFEEHLLVCEECQKTLATTEEYIRLMKGASLAYAACLGGGRHHSAGPLKRTFPAEAAQFNNVDKVRIE